MSLLGSRVWPGKRLKYVVSLRRGRVDGLQDERPYIGLEDIESGTGRLIANTVGIDARTDATISGGSLCSTFEPGDVLFGKLRPYLAKAWIAEFAGRCTTELLVMEPADLASRFLRYVCLSRDFVDAVDRSTFGSKMPRADWDFIGNLQVPVPELSRQRVIADYLDRETARLDGLVRAKERVLGLLAEKRRALITRAVTSGIDSSAPLSDSGISWLEKIPAHWQTARSKWLFRERDERTTTGEEVLLSLRMERGLVPHNEVSEKATRSEELVGYKKVTANEIVVNRMRAAIGLIAMSPQDGLVSPDYAVFQCEPDVDPQYFTHLFKIELLQAVFRSESTGLGTGSSGFLRLYSENFLSLWFPYPSLLEQQEIVDYIARETAKLDALRSATERTITLLKERRAALIAAAVTGQIDVRELVHRSRKRGDNDNNNVVAQ